MIVAYVFSACSDYYGLGRGEEGTITRTAAPGWWNQVDSGALGVFTDEAARCDWWHVR